MLLLALVSNPYKCFVSGIFLLTPCCAIWYVLLMVLECLYFNSSFSMHHGIIISGSPTHTPFSSAYVFEASKQNLPHHCVDLLPVVSKVFWNLSEEGAAHSVSGWKCVVYFLQTFLRFDKIL